MSELIDVYSDNMEVVGSATREEAERRGLWHRSFHCWIVARRPSGDSVLFQLRGPDKTLFPDTLDITAAGHLTAGESPEDGIRELEEELGVKVAHDNLTYLGVRCDVAEIGTILNREFCDTYLLRDDRDLSNYTLQVSELAGLAEIKITDGLKLFSGQTDTINAQAISVHHTGQFTRPVTVGDIIPRTDRYYLKVMLMAQQLLADGEYFAI